MRVLAGVLFLAGLLAVTSLSTAQPPGGGKGGQGGKGGKGFPGGGGKGGGGFGGMAAMQPGQIMPAFIGEMLKLTDEQKKQVETLQKDVDEKLAKILTDDQKKQLKEMKERGPGGFGGGGAGGFPGGPGRPGGAGGKGGNPPPPPEE